MSEFSRGGLLLRYFLHGIAFSLLGLVLLFAWAILLVFLMTVGSFIGLIIGVIVLLLFIGGLNAFLSGIIWSLNVKTGLMSLLGQGFVLGILQLIAHIPAIITDLTMPSLASTIVVFLVYCFVDGFIARKVGGWFAEEFVPENEAYSPVQTD